MASTEKKIRKGGLARINEAAAFTTQNGGSRQHPHDCWDSDERRILRGSFRLTNKQQQEWRDRKREEIKEARAKGEDTFSIAFDDAGESRLAPQNGYVDLKAGHIYQVLRGRMRAHIGYHVYPGYMMVLDPESGYEVMVPRKYMEAV
jgi:hypothetical protein|tara:strand:- start:975 stop:1415 length:441 start_codon:yes stop_codon:yes gene_type:complete